MESPKISVRLDTETYSNLLRLAQVERKTIAELVRELIERGLRTTGDESGKADATDVLHRLDVLEMQISDLLVKAVKAGAGARFLSRLAVSFSSDTVSWLTEQRLADGQSKDKLLADVEAQADRYSEDYLIKPE